MPIGANPNYADTNSEFYSGTTVTVGTSAVEAKVDVTRNPDRQLLIIYNASNNPMYYGPSGVTTSNGIPLLKGQEVAIPIKDLAVYLIAGSAGNTAIVQELG